MRVFVQNLILFAALALAFSSLAGCTGQVTVGGNPSPSEPPAVPGSSPSDVKKSAYPPAPAAIMNAEVKLLDGTSIKLQDKKGKVVLVNLWATWCGPCKAEMPHLVELQDKYRDQGFEIYGLDTDDETKEMIEDFKEAKKLNYTMGWADETLMTEFVRLTGLQGIPQSILIDREGHLTGVFTGGGASTINKLKETVEKIVAQ